MFGERGGVLTPPNGSSGRTHRRKGRLPSGGHPKVNAVIGRRAASERDARSSRRVAGHLRKAVQDLVRGGILIQRHGSGTFVAPRVSRVEQPLSRLTSFTEDMARRGMLVRSQWLDRGLYPPSPEEMMTLGLSPSEQVARVARLRVADDTPLAIERASLSAAILPDPGVIGESLYAALDKTGHRPVRAIQRLSAKNLNEAEAALLGAAPGSASLNIERISYLASGKVIEFTRSVYRGDAYDFVVELRLGDKTDEGQSRT